MGIREVIGDKRDAILTLAAKHGARNVRVFGSVADGSADEASDVDFLVEMESGRSLLDLGLVDTVEVGVIPVLLGGGIPLLPARSQRTTLRLVSSKVYKATGTVGLEYAVEQGERKQQRKKERKKAQP